MPWACPDGSSKCGTERRHGSKRRAMTEHIPDNEMGSTSIQVGDTDQVVALIEEMRAMVVRLSRETRELRRKWPSSGLRLRLLSCLQLLDLTAQFLMISAEGTDFVA